MNRLEIILAGTLCILITACAHLPAPNIVHQADWGGTPASVDSAQSIKYITIHHSGVVFEPGKNPRTYLQNLQSWSRAEKGWVDIPYHFLIDLEGVIYEGRDVRLSGDTNTSYDVRGHLIICVLGNYEEQSLNETQFNALVRLTALEARRYGVTPDRIQTHHDLVPDETVCPGRDIQRLFDDGSFLRAVSALPE